MMQLTNEELQKAEEKVKTASEGKFFKTNNARLLPSFDRGGDEETSDSDEFTLGVTLGEGAFCDVKEITAIALKRKTKEEDSDDVTAVSDNNKVDDVDEADFPVNLFRNKAEIREYMSQNCMRIGDTANDNNNIEESGQARYALKQLKPTDKPKQLYQGLVDISIEAKFLACLNHPNIIKMRGLAGDPLSSNFGIVLDRLYDTLEDKMDMWTEEKKSATNSGMCGCLFGSMDANVRSTLMVQAITVAYDLSCALRYIHDQNLVYRDIKPENAGFDVRGDVKLFDFGFCKELTKKLYDKSSGMYKLTKLTGSIPYMAPENYIGKPYGKGVDVFSYGVLLWEMLHQKFAFYHYDRQDYKMWVVEKNFRPPIDKSLSTRVQELIKESWDPDPKKRLSFTRISLILRAEFQEISEFKGGSDGLSRSQHLLGASVRSFRARSRK